MNKYYVGVNGETTDRGVITPDNILINETAPAGILWIVDEIKITEPLRYTFHKQNCLAAVEWE